MSADSENRSGIEATGWAVDSRRCVGCAACSALLPGLFAVGGGSCRVLRAARPDELALCRAAALNCPTHAIHRSSVPERAGIASSQTNDLFPELAVQAEQVRWSLGDIPWPELNPGVASPELRELVREMAFSENATYSATQRFLQTFYDDVEFTQWISVWFYEETRHPHVLIEWLRRLGEPVVDDFILRGRVSTPFMKSRMGTLVTNVISEVSASHAYGALADASAEPVLAILARRIAGDEARHAASFFRFARKRLEASDRPDRERLDGLKVLQFWLSGSEQVSHPVNQMLQRLSPNALRAASVASSGMTSSNFGKRITRLVGLLLGLPIRDPADVDVTLRELVATVHQHVVYR